MSTLRMVMFLRSDSCSVMGMVTHSTSDSSSDLTRSDEGGGTALSLFAPSKASALSSDSEEEEELLVEDNVVVVVIDVPSSLTVVPSPYVIG